MSKRMKKLKKIFTSKAFLMSVAVTGTTIAAGGVSSVTAFADEAANTMNTPAPETQAVADAVEAPIEDVSQEAPAAATEAAPAAIAETAPVFEETASAVTETTTVDETTPAASVEETSEADKTPAAPSEEVKDDTSTTPADGTEDGKTADNGETPAEDGKTTEDGTSTSDNSGSSETKDNTEGVKNNSTVSNEEKDNTPEAEKPAQQVNETPAVKGNEGSKVETKTTQEVKKAETSTVSQSTTNSGYTYSSVVNYNYVRQNPADINFGIVQATASRREIINYALQFVGNPYVWGGTDPVHGADCSGFVQSIYKHFGVDLPRVAESQAMVGKRIAVSDAKPGDLIFFMDSTGYIYHVAMYLGNGKTIEAKGSEYGIGVFDVYKPDACWAVSLVNDDEYTTTLAEDMVETGKKAAAGDEQARKDIIEALATSCTEAWDMQGIKKSVLIANIIKATNWMSFELEDADGNPIEGAITADDNNVMSMVADIDQDGWESKWTEDKAEVRNIKVNPVKVDKKEEDKSEEDKELEKGIKEDLVRTYDDIESSINDYASLLAAKDEKIADRNTTVEDTLKVVTDNTEDQAELQKIIDDNKLEKYDTDSAIALKAADGTEYTQEQLELIWAIVNQEDGQSYEGALAVITTAMNRADQNYGGYGTNALSQLTAPGQFCYSPSVADPSYYQRWLGGNVPEYVKSAVEDCLVKGMRNHDFLSFRAKDGGGWTQIGTNGNWYF